MLLPLELLASVSSAAYLHVSTILFEDEQLLFAYIWTGIQYACSAAALAIVAFYIARPTSLKEVFAFLLESAAVELLGSWVGTSRKRARGSRRRRSSRSTSVWGPE